MASLGELTVALKAQTDGFTAKFGDAGKVVRAFEKAANDAAKAQRYMEQAGGGTIKTLRQLDQEARAAAKAQRQLEAETRRAAKALEMQQRAEDRSSKRGGFSAIRGIATEMNSFLSILQRVGAVMSGVFKMMEDGARAATAESFFRNAGKSIGEYRTATHGLVADAELMKKANLADSMGLSESTFKTLAQVATAAAAKTGQSFDYMFNSIVVGTARSSRLLLDNLGIIVSVKEANEKYAKSLKESDTAGQYANMTITQMSENLSDEAKKLAFAEEVTRKSKDTLVEYGNATVTASERFDSFAAAYENLRISIAQNLFSSDYLDNVTSVIVALTTMIDRLKHVAVLQMLPQAIVATGKGMLSDPLGKEGMSPVQRLMTELYASLEDAEVRAFDATVNLKKYLEKSGVDYQHALSMTSADIENFSSLYGDEIGKQIVLFQKLNDSLKNSPFMAAKKAGADGRPGLDQPEVGGGKKSTEKEPQYKNTFDWMEAYNENLKDQVKIQEANTKRLAKQEEDADKYQKALAKAQQDYLDAKAEELKKFLESIDAWKKAMDESAATKIGIGASALSGDVTGLVTSLGEVLGGLMGMPAAGGAIGSFLGPILEEIKPVADLFLQLTEAAKRLITNGFGELLNTIGPLGDALMGFLVASGNLLASAIRPLLPIFIMAVHALSFFLDVLTAVVVVFSPLIEVLMSLTTLLLGMIAPIESIVNMFLGFAGIEFEGNIITGGLEAVGNVLLDGAIGINNAFVALVRSIGEWLTDTVGEDFGLSTFGKELTRDDFELDPAAVEATEDNTDKTADNTRAVRDLTREFRNLPSGYKVNNAIYNATAPGRPGALPIGLMPGFSPRDQFRGRL